MATVIIEKLSQKDIQIRGIRQWPIWEKEVSRFDHFYDSEEECYFIDGEVVIETKGGNYNIEPGDFVTFQKGLECTWDIKKAVKKHYDFKE